uniref:Uncharacterized protein n=1 Tax=Brugia timori TaxID=42155 RepID=A0A0R3Q5Z7_9BILA
MSLFMKFYCMFRYFVVRRFDLDNCTKEDLNSQHRIADSRQSCKKLFPENVFFLLPLTNNKMK